MPKIKTNRSAAKRFDVTGSGKVKRKKAYHSHILSKKAPKRKRSLRKGALVAAADGAELYRRLVSQWTGPLPIRGAVEPGFRIDDRGARVRRRGDAGEHEDAGTDDRADAEQREIDGPEHAPKPRVAQVVVGIDGFGAKQTFHGRPGLSMEVAAV